MKGDRGGDVALHVACLSGKNNRVVKEGHRHGEEENCTLIRKESCIETRI